MEHPIVCILVESRDTNLLQVTEEIYKGEYKVASSIFTHTLMQQPYEWATK